MGKAIVISGADFSAAGIGQVTPTEYRELLSITLEEGATVGNKVTIDVTYNPHNATFKELIWSIESGSEYATISNGVLSVLQGADNSPVTVKAVSAHDESIYDTTTVYVTYNPLALHDGLVFDGASGVDTDVAVNGSHKIEIKFTANSQFIDISAQEFRILFGGRTSSSSNRRDIQYSKYADNKKLYPGSFAFGVGSTSQNINVYKQNGDIITLLSTPTSVAVDDTAESVSIPSFSLALNYWVGCQNQADSTHATAYMSRDIVHYVKIWDSNDNLIAHFVPATYYSEAGLYDLISETFHGNELEGNLTVEDYE